MLPPASPWCWMVPSPTASRTAPSSVSSKRPANAPSEKRVANLFTTVGGTRSNACSSTGGGGVCAEQSFPGIAKRRNSKKSVFRPSTPNCLTLEIERFCCKPGTGIPYCLRICLPLVFPELELPDPDSREHQNRRHDENVPIRRPLTGSGDEHQQG